MLRVYTASKLEEYERWLELQKTHPEIFFHARWIKHMQIGTQNRAERAEEFWLQDQEDVESADVLLLYNTPGRIPKGSLVESGMAISAGVPIVVVCGDDPENTYGNWIYHTGVKRVKTLEEALEYISKLDIGWRKKKLASKHQDRVVYTTLEETNHSPWDGGIEQ